MFLKFLNGVAVSTLDLSTANSVHKNLKGCATHCVPSILTIGSICPRWPDRPREKYGYRGDTPRTPRSGIIKIIPKLRVKSKPATSETFRPTTLTLRPQPAAVVKIKGSIGGPFRAAPSGADWSECVRHVISEDKSNDVASRDWSSRTRIRRRSRGSRAGGIPQGISVSARMRKSVINKNRVPERRIPLHIRTALQTPGRRPQQKLLL